MYRNLTPLKHADHGTLRLLPVTDYDFARGQLAAPIVIDEIADVAREYPIVFPAGRRLPVALMGVEKDSNAYVGTDGKWLATYIPAHIRNYPLALRWLPPEPQAARPGEQAPVQDRFAVLVDVESPFVSTSGGEPLFNADGSLAPTAQPRLRILEQMQTRARVTRRLVQAIDGAGLFSERAIRIRRAGEPDHQVSGIRVIDEAALNKLDDAAFNALRRSGALPLVYASLLSWANFRLGPIGKSHPLQMAPLAEDDVIRFS